MRFQRLISFFTLFAYLLTCRLTGTSVLCFCYNGHVCVEDFGARCCDDESRSADGRHPHGRALAKAAGSSNCGSCVDIPLGDRLTQHSALITAAPKPPCHPHSALPVLAAQVPAPQDFPSHQPLSPPTLEPPGVTLLRTVVLRC